MAIASWLKINGTATTVNGSANGTFTLNAVPNTGRNSRSSTVTIKGDGVSQDKTVSVTQSGKEGFISINAGQAAIAKGGGSITIYGKSNASALKFEWINYGSTSEPDYDNDGNVSDPVTGTDYPEATIATQYSGAGVSQNNGVGITGDPGASAEYDWSVGLTFPNNPYPTDIKRVLKVYDPNDKSISTSLTFTQACTTAFVTVSPTSYTFAAEGGETTITVTSNTTWVVS